MKALSIQQPWADLILSGEKWVENRTWSTKVRGRVLIHAGKRYDRESLDFIFDNIRHSRRSAELENLVLMSPSNMGGLVGSVEIVDCVTSGYFAVPGQRQWVSGPFCFVLKNPVRFDVLIPYKGALGFFEVPQSVLEPLACV